MLDAAANQRIPSAVAPDVPEHHRCRCISGPRWAVARTHPQAERWADTNLHRCGYETYLPLLAVARPDRVTPTLRHIVLTPLFTSYLFVAHDPRDSWRPIYETPGVASVLRNGSELQYANAGDISVLQATEASRRLLRLPAPPLAPGTPVAVANGILAGYPAVVLSVHRQTAHIAVMLLGALRSVSVPLDQLTTREP